MKQKNIFDQKLESLEQLVLKATSVKVLEDMKRLAIENNNLGSKQRLRKLLQSIDWCIESKEFVKACRG